MPGVITWVLGSGFSRALGGPLLCDLLADRTQQERIVFYPSEQFPRVHDSWCRSALDLYKFGLRPKQEKVGGELWGDPEEFVTALDTAALNGRESKRWNMLLRALAQSRRSVPLTNAESDLQAIGAAARRLIAADCSMFLIENDPENSELWQPYRHWAGQLDGRDVILSFNYDLVLEMLKDTTAAQLDIPLPGEARHDGHPVVLKLHGSIDWRRMTPERGGAVMYVRENDDFAMNAEDSELAIAAPGPSKQLLVRELEQHWTRAESYLAHSDAVVFLGYRFPPSDAESRQRLLGAIRRNQNIKLAIYAVLGPDNPDSPRLSELLRRSSHNPHPDSIQCLPLYAQDFLSVYDVGRFREEIGATDRSPARTTA